MKKIILSCLLISSLFSYDQIEQNIPDDLELPEISTEKIQIPTNAVDPTQESLPLFAISCSGIKYTGAYEQIWIDMLEDSKTYIKEVIKPYTSMSELDAAIYTYAFASCMKNEMEAEVKGDETHSSLTQKATEAVAEGGNDVIVKTGVSSSAQASVNVEAEVNVKANAAGTASKITESSGEEGVFSNVVRCIMDEREKAYLELYNILSYSLKMKMVLATATNGACNVPLKQENETIPSWSEMTGVDMNDYVNDLFKNDDTSSDNLEEKSRVNEFMSEYFNDVFSFDLSTNSEVCKKWNSSTGQCEAKVKLDTKECKTDSNGFLVGGCNCVQGVNILTGNPCSLPEDYEFNKKYGKNITYDSATIDNIEVSEGEKLFFNTLANTSYQTSYIPYEMFFSSDLVLTNWNVALKDKTKGFLNFPLYPRDNFKVQVRSFSDSSLALDNPMKFNLHSDKYSLIAETEFSENLISYLVIDECADNAACETQYIEDQYVSDEKFDSVIQRYLEIKKKYESTINFLGNIYDFYPNIDNYKKKVYNIQNALKEIFESSSVGRTVAFPNNFLNLWLIKSYQLENTMKLENRSEKDIWIVKNFAKRYYLSFPSTTTEDFRMLNRQMYDMSDQTFNQRKMNLKFMKLNSEIEAQKASLLRILYK